MRSQWILQARLASMLEELKKEMERTRDTFMHFKLQIVLWFLGVSCWLHNTCINKNLKNGCTENKSLATL